MKKIALIVVWAGKLPDYFQIWLYSCKNNPSIDFYVFTDDRTEYEYPVNVKYNFYSFEELRQKFRKIFPFEISLERPYKFCDYKPAYGEAFSSYLKGYDFWGYCDIDLIWGNIRKFLTDEVLEDYDRFFTRGHCSIFRNDEKINSYYRTLPANGHLDYKMVYQSDKPWCFDEWATHCGGGLSVILKEHNIPTYDEPMMADIDVAHGRFAIHRREDLKKVDYFAYSRGNLYACQMKKKDEIKQTPILYCHFQKRKIKLADNLNANEFVLLPPGEIRNEDDPKNKMFRSIKILYFDLVIFLKKVWSRIRALS